jgi:Glycosyltransferase like family 2
MLQRDGVEVVIPLRWDAGNEVEHQAAVVEMAAYLARLVRHADVVVVDGSAGPRFAQHRRAWGAFAHHVRPDERPGANGKVVGAMTGVRMARHERIVLADDDVRYDERSLRDVVALLGAADLVRPANVFSRWPWHARWDGSRSLLNRAVAADWPGTFAVRRSLLLRTGGWDADVMFENLELVRTVQAAGGIVLSAPRVLVPRLPPTARHFWSQRVRQAYDDLAQPWRLVCSLATVPAVVVGLRHRPGVVAMGACAAMAVAELGRRRDGAARVVPPSVPLFAPLWILERGFCSWLAVSARLRGGVRYNGRRMKVAAHSRRTIGSRLGRRPAPSLQSRRRPS